MSNVQRLWEEEVKISRICSRSLCSSYDKSKEDANSKAHKCTTHTPTTTVIESIYTSDVCVRRAQTSTRVRGQEALELMELM